MKKLTSVLFTKKTIILLLIFIIGFSLFIVKPKWLFKDQSLNNIKTITVNKNDLSATITASGQIEAENQATIKFLTTGKVASINVKEGDFVNKGQVLASLDSSEAQLAVSKAESALRSAQSTVDKVIDDIKLFRYTADANGETQTQKNDREKAQAARDGASADLLKYQKELETYSLTAPFDGTISKITDMEEGQNITATSQSSISIVGNGMLKFAVNVDETDFKYLKEGQNCKISLDAFSEDTFTCRILKIGVVADKLSTGGSIIPVELSLPINKNFKSGLNGEAEFKVTIKENAFTLPRSVIHKKEDKNFVNILRNNKIEQKDVQVGQSVGGQTEIISGVSEGDQVVIGDVEK